MKSLLVSAVTIAALAGIPAIASHIKASAQEAAPGDAPWQVGQCYRVFPSEPDKFHTFKVLAPAQGNWLRVQPAPASPTVPGGRAQAPLWINTASPFAVQEWTCGL